MSVSLKQSYDIEYDGTANVARMDLFVDTAADLTGLTTFDSITLLQGSTAEDISTGDEYMMQTNGTWVKQPSQSAFANVYTKAEIDSMFYLYYTKAEADSLFEWITVTISTDTLPLSFKADGTPLISWSMLGNGQQTGTPTPDNPVMPEFAGTKTANLCKINGFDSGATEQKLLQTVVLNAGTYTYSCVQNDNLASNTRNCLMVRVGLDPYIYEYTLPDYHLSAGKHTMTFTVTSDNSSVELRYWINSFSNVCHFDDFMLNSGSTALPYEPYGYKIPITCAGQTVPVYLGQTQTVRRIKKLVLTGEEDAWGQTDDINSGFYFDITGYLRQRGVIIAICSHYVSQGNINGAAEMQDGKISFYANVTQPSSRFYIKDSNCANLADFKSYLSAQYAAGTPVVVWYVLATPETGIVNEPLAKIGDYADELSSEDAGVTIPTEKGSNTLTVESELQPSEMTITGKIREVTENEQ